MDSPPTFWFRLKTLLGLVCGLRRHDFRAARSFASMQFSGRSPLVKFGKFLAWALRQMWCEIPETIRSSRFEKPISRVPIWLADGNPWANYPWNDNPQAQLPGSAHTVVIGAGLAGSALAYHWGKKADKDQTMVLLDMADAASGSAGRNEGLVVVGRYYHMVYSLVLPQLRRARRDLSDTDVDKLAHQFAATYCKSCYRNAKMIHETIVQEGFECDYVCEGWVQAHDGGEQEKLEDSVRMAIETGFTDWCKITPEEVERRSGMKVRHNAGFSLAAASFHPAKWCWSLLERGMESGNILFYSRTKVGRVEDAGDEYLVHTARNPIRAKYVVNATESYTPLLHKQFHNVVQPTQTQAARVKGAPARMKPAVGISNSRAFFTRHDDNVVLGTDATRVPDQQAGRNQPSRFLTKYVIGEMVRAMGPGNYHVTNEWSGTVTYTPDQYPIIGVFDGKRQYILGGMAGSGTAVSFNGARCVVNRILGITGEEDNYPEPYFSATRFLDPANHRWPEIDG